MLAAAAVVLMAVAAGPGRAAAAPIDADPATVEVQSDLTYATPDGTALALPEAIDFATGHEAHLTAYCLGVDMTPAGGFYMGASPIMLQETLERAQTDAEALQKKARQLFEGRALRWGAESAVAQFGGLPGLVGLRARFSDLVIQSGPYGEGTSSTQEAVIEAALFEGQAPVLVLPPGGLGKGFGERIVVAWNQSNEALSAVRKALPLLQAAQSVQVVVVDPPVHSPERSDPGGLLTQMLAHVTGLKPGDFVHTLGDAHLYLNHLEQARLQLTRDPRPLPKMAITRHVPTIFDFRYEDFELTGYDAHPHIKAEVSV